MAQWTDEQRAALDLAVNESEVLGLVLSEGGRWCDVLLHVVALTDADEIDTDPRRRLRLHQPSLVDVLLRPSTVHGLGTPLPLRDLQTVESFFASIGWFDAMYGWRFFDADNLTADWPPQVSLTVTPGDGTGSHTFYWFNECGRDEGEHAASYCIEGRIAFESLEVLRADGTPVPIDAFTDAARRWWDAFEARQPALTPQAQQNAQAVAPSWRPNAPMTSALVPGSPGPAARSTD